MPGLANYNDLVANIARWLNRTDLAGDIPNFIRLAESRMFRDLRAFVLRQGVTMPLVGADGGGAAVPLTNLITPPAGINLGVTLNEVLFVGVRKSTNGVAEQITPMTLIDEHELRRLQTQFPRTGKPEMYAIVNQGPHVYPTPDIPAVGAPASDARYELVLSIQGPSGIFAFPITASNSANNPILRDHPDLYLYGALAESAPFLKADSRVAIWDARFQEAAVSARRHNDNMTYFQGGRAPRIRLPRVFS